MTKQHFVKLASALRLNKHNVPLAEFIKLCGDIADVCALANPRFQRAKFLEACGARS